MKFLLFRGIRAKADRAECLFISDDNDINGLPRQLTGTFKMEHSSVHYRRNQNTLLATASRFIRDSIRVYAQRILGVAPEIERTLERLDDFEEFHYAVDELYGPKVVFATAEFSIIEAERLGKAAVDAIMAWHKKEPTKSALRLTVATLSAIKQLKLSHYRLFWSHVCRRSLLLAQNDSECDRAFLSCLESSQNVDNNACLSSYERELVSAVCFALLLAASDEVTKTSALWAHLSMSCELEQHLTSGRLEAHRRSGCRCSTDLPAPPVDDMSVSWIQSRSACPGHAGEAGIVKAPHARGES